MNKTPEKEQDSRRGTKLQIKTPEKVSKRKKTPEKGQHSKKRNTPPGKEQNS